MGIWATLKQKLGISGVKLDLEIPPQAGKDSGEIQGRLSMFSKSDQTVNALHFRIVEEYTTGRKENQKTEEFELGKTTVAGPFEIKAGESKTIDLSLPFQFRATISEKLKGKGGALGALGKASSFMAAEKSEYRVWVNGDVLNTSLGPNDFKRIELV